MQKIIPHLWFDKEAKEAAEFYVSLFGNGSKVIGTTKLKNTPSGDADVVSFELLGMKFMSISAGPLFKFNPSISFFVGCETEAEVDRLWAGLSEGGEALMPLGTYPFSDRYGWIQDKYGLSWQLILTKPEGNKRPKVMPSLLFVGDNAGKADEAINFYLSVFKDSTMGDIARYPAGMEPDKEGTVMYADFKLFDVWLAAMDSAHEHNFNFNEAISLMVSCKDQAEIDYYWEKLSADPAAEQCGWLKDKYGVSWQVTPAVLETMMQSGDAEKVKRVTEAFLRMKKFDIAGLEEAYHRA